MTIDILCCEQGTPDWFRCRLGIPTASQFDAVLAKPQKGKPYSKTRRTYLYKLAGERLTTDPMEEYSNWHMERGKGMEDEARRMYCFAEDVEPKRVGFIRNNKLKAGCSPDALIGDIGGLEVKTKLPHLLIECHLDKGFPPEHKAQTQGFLLLTDREWIDLCVYWPKVPLYIRRAYRDEAYIKDLTVALSCFNEELDQVVERMQNETYTPSVKDKLRSSLELGV
jgi:hypothetical protein